MKLVRRTTGQVIYDVKRLEYPNRNGYYFGASIYYVGKTRDNKKVEIPARELGKYIDGLSVGDKIWNGATIRGLEQKTKNTLKISYQYNDNPELYEDFIQGRIVNLS